MAWIFKSNYRKLKKSATELGKRFKQRTSNKEIIMGCDLSAHSTGISIINKEDELIFMDKIFIVGYNKTPLDLRINTFVLGLQKIINTYKPSIAIVEDIFASNIRTHNTLARLHGVFLYMMIKNNIKVYYIHPSSAKAFIGCKTKEEVFEKITKIYGLKLDFKQHNDGVDGLLMALNHKNKIKLKEI